MIRKDAENHMLMIYFILLITVLASFSRADSCPEPKLIGIDKDEQVVSRADQACKARYGTNACLYELEKVGDRYRVQCGPEVPDDGK